MTAEYYAKDESAMLAFGKALLSAMEAEGVVFLLGDLGMGKTTLSRGVVQAAGHKGAVKSPTYTLVEPYEFPGSIIYHFDLYRLSDPEELEYLGIRDYFDKGMLSLVEWPNRGEGYLPTADLEINLSIKHTGRLLELQANTLKGQRAIDLLLAGCID